MHVSLKDLFGIVTLAALVAWSIAWAGWDNLVHWTVLCGLGILSTAFVRMARSGRRGPFALLLPVPLLAGCVLSVGSLALIADAVLLFLAGMVSTSRPPLRIKTLNVVALTLAVVSLGIGALPGISAVRELKALRQKFPVVSLANRLRYEHSGRPNSIPQLGNMSSSVSISLNELETSQRGFSEYGFRLIHDRQYERFVRSSGFGVGRMVPMMRPARLHRPPLRDIPFEFEEQFIPVSDDFGNSWRGFARAGQSNQMEDIHAFSQFDFLDPLGFGAVIDPLESVVGFVAHAFHYTPIAATEDPDHWTIERLELVSLLRFDEPRVYVLDHLPRMDQLASEDVPTRSLDAFESEALEQLWSQTDLVITEESGLHRMLGSLRAANQCLDCHTAQRGELLGAFSYVLRRHR